MKKFSLIISFTIFALLLFVRVAAAATVTIESSATSVKINDAFNLNVYLSDASDLYGASVDLIFDPALVQVAKDGNTPTNGENAVEEGQVLPAPGYVINQFNNSTGTVNFAECLIGNVSGVNVIKKTLICTIPLKAVGNGTIPIVAASYNANLSNLSLNGATLLVHLSDSAAQPISFVTPQSIMVGAMNTTDKTTLANAITAAQTLLNIKQVGNEVGYVPQVEYEAYSNAITAAAAIRDDANATQTDVDEQVLALALATTTFNNAEITQVERTAAEVAGGINIITPPAQDALSIVLPSVPSGFTISIKSSDKPNVISTSGNITPPASNTTVTLVLTVVRSSDGTSADTSSLSVVVPAKTVTIASAAEVAAGITTISAPAKDATSIAIPGVPTGFTVLIKSSDNPGVISTSGSIIPPSNNTTVILVLKVVRSSDGTSADTVALSVVVPAKTAIVTNGTIVGRVTEPTGSTNGNLGGVTVTVVGTLCSAITGSDGSYTIADVPTGTSYTLKFEKIKYATFLENNVNVTKGTTTTVDKLMVLMGDVNGDGFINVSDAGAILMNFVKGTPLLYSEAADVNKDTYINVSDAGAIVMYYVKGTQFN